MYLGHQSTDSDTSGHLNCSHSGLRDLFPGGEGEFFFSATSATRAGGGGADEQRPEPALPQSLRSDLTEGLKCQGGQDSMAYHMELREGLCRLDT